MTAPTLSAEARAVTRLSPAALAAASIPSGCERFPVTDKAAWKQLRRADVTASQVTALVAAHPYCTARELYAQKLGLIEDQEVEPEITETSISLPPLLRGTLLEPAALEMIRQLRPAWDVQPCGYYYREPESRIGATPDLWAVNPERRGFGIIQVKTADRMTFGKWRGDVGILPPMYVLGQATVEAVLTGASWCAVAVLVTGANLDLHMTELPIEPAVIRNFRAHSRHFWRELEAGRQPDLQRDERGNIVERDGRLLDDLFDPREGEVIDLSADNELPALLDEKAKLAADKTVAEKRLRAIKAELVDKIGGAAAARVSDGRLITAKRVTRRAHQVAESDYVDIRVKAARTENVK